MNKKHLYASLTLSRPLVAIMHWIESEIQFDLCTYALCDATSVHLMPLVF